MAGWSVHEGRAVVLPRRDVDTDQIIPARFMSASRADGYGQYLFADLREGDDGFPLDRHRGASVLIAGANFGCGSSREAAVYALVDAGIRAVIAPSFADIFAGNAVNNGLLPAALPDAEALMDELGANAAEARIDLETATLTIAGQSHEFRLPDVWRHKLTNGWDDIDLTRAHLDEIAAFRDARHANAPWVWAEQDDEQATAG